MSCFCQYVPSCIVIRQLRLVKRISLIQRIVVLERTFGRGDWSYPAHRCLGKAWQACLETVCRAPRGPTGAPRGLVWGVAIVRSAKTAVWLPLPGPPGGLSGAPGGLSGSPGSCLERQEGCLERQEGLSGRPGARLVVLPAAWSAWSAGKTVWSAWRSENVGRSDVLEFPLQEAPRAPRAPRGPKSPKSSKSPKRPRTLRSPVWKHLFRFDFHIFVNVSFIAFSK